MSKFKLAFVALCVVTIVWGTAFYTRLEYARAACFTIFRMEIRIIRNGHSSVSNYCMGCVLRKVAYAESFSSFEGFEG